MSEKLDFRASTTYYEQKLYWKKDEQEWRKRMDDNIEIVIRHEYGHYDDTKQTCTFMGHNVTRDFIDKHHLIEIVQKPYTQTSWVSEQKLEVCRDLINTLRETGELR